MQLLSGRPQDVSGRLEREVAVYDLLDRLHIPYERIDHEETNTMEACSAIDGALRVTMCKNLFLCNRQGTRFYLLMMPGDKPFRTKDLSAQIGSARLSFADAEHMEQLLHIHPGAVSVMGLMNDTEGRVTLLIDRDVVRDAYIGCHPCVSTTSLRISTRDVLSVFLPAVHHAPQLVTLPRYDAPAAPDAHAAG